MDARVVHTIAGEAGRSWWGPGDMYTFLVTGEESGGSLFALDCLVSAGGGPPPHRHLAEDELFTITEGRITFGAGEETRTVSAGESVFVPPRDAAPLSERGKHGREDDRRLHPRRDGGLVP